MLVYGTLVNTCAEIRWLDLRNSQLRTHGERQELPALITAEPKSSTSVERAEGEYILSLTLRDLLLVIRRRLWFIALVALVLMGTVVGYSVSQTPTYEASIQILVGQERVGQGDGPFQNAGD